MTQDLDPPGRKKHPAPAPTDAPAPAPTDVPSDAHREDFVAGGPVFQRADYEDFVALLGKAGAARWLGRLDRMLRSAFDQGGQTPEDLRKAAHAMVPLAGMPGFADLASRCTALEHAIATQSAYGNELTAARDEARRVAGLVGVLRSGLDDGGHPVRQ